MVPYALLFKPILKEKVWGGRALKRLGKRLPPGVNVGESWELADLPDGIAGGMSIVENGVFAGRSLRDLLEHEREDVLGAAEPSPEGRFPLLIKYLDARQNLSVQVHPDEAYVRNNPGTHLKSEAWVVVDAAPDAVIYNGLKSGVTRDAFWRAIEQGSVPTCLHRVPARVGECHYLPSGTVHALGAGVVVAEVQTPSDTTFRVFDWGREGSESPRSMHIHEALACIRFGEAPRGPEPTPPPMEVGGIRSRRLVKTPYFEIEQVNAIDEAAFRIVTSELPEIWMILSGSGQIPTADGPMVELGLGRTALIPASHPELAARLARGTSMLRITLPSPIEGLIA